MKNILIALLTILSLSFLDTFTMDKQQSLYKEIEQIAPDASKKSYLNMVYKLYKNKQSLCSCIKAELARERALAEEHFEKNKKLENGSIQRLQKLFQQERDPKPTITIDPALADIVDLDTLKQTILEANISTSIECKVAKLPSFWKWLLGYDNEYTDLVALIGTRKRSHALLINPLVKNLSKEAQRGIWLHELEHARQKHDSLSDAIALYDKSRTSLSLISNQKCYEREADRLPAICGSAYDAYCLEKTMIKLEKIAMEENLKLQKILARNLPNNNGSIDNNLSTNEYDPHEPIKVRVAWATRIRKLKQAEQQFSKNLEQYKAMKHNARNFAAMNQFE